MTVHYPRALLFASTLPALGAADVALAGGAVSHVTSGNKSEHTDRLDIKQTAQVVFSVPIEGLLAGDTLHLRAEMGVTNDLATADKQTGAAYDFSGEWRYDARVDARIVLATAPDAVDGTILGTLQDYVVKAPMHHGKLNIDADYTVPGPTGAAFINFVAEAATVGTEPTKCIKRMNGEDYGGKCMLTIEQDHGRLGVIRETPAPLPWSTAAESTPTQLVAKIPCPNDDNNKPKKVVYSHPLGPLVDQEILDFKARVQVWSDFSNGKYNGTLASGYMVIAAAPDLIDGVEVAEQNGFNLHKSDPKEFYEKIGTHQVAAASADNFLNFVMLAGAGCMESEGGYLYIEANVGALAVVRHRPPEPAPDETTSGSEGGGSTEGPDSAASTGGASDADDTGPATGDPATGGPTPTTGDPGDPTATSATTTATTTTSATTTATTTTSATTTSGDDATGPGVDDAAGEGCNCRDAPHPSPSGAVVLACLLGALHRRRRGAS